MTFDLQLRREAVGAGKSMYESLRVCNKCQTAVRFTNDGKCVECNRVNCRRRSLAKQTDETRAARAEKQKRAEAKQAISERYRAAQRARREALETGATTYLGRPCPNGHDGLRYTVGGGCHACSRAFVMSSEKKAYDRQRHARLRDVIATRQRALYEANRTEKIAAAKAWGEKNPDKVRAIKQNHKHKRRAKESSGVSYSELRQWKAAQKKVCYWCRCDCAKGFVVDHYQPLAKGGAHELSNLVIACRPCNARKSARDPLEFAASKGMLF